MSARSASVNWQDGEKRINAANGERRVKNLVNCMQRFEGRVRDDGNESADKGPSGLVAASFFLLGNSYNREAGLTDLATNSRGAARPRGKRSAHRLTRPARRRAEIKAKSRKVSQDPPVIPNLNHRRLEARSAPIEPPTPDFSVGRGTTSRWVRIRAPGNSLTLSLMTSLPPIPRSSRSDRSIFWLAGTVFVRN